jgi:hypothetical protein
MLPDDDAGFTRTEERAGIYSVDKKSIVHHIESGGVCLAPACFSQRMFILLRGGIAVSEKKEHHRTSK